MRAHRDLGDNIRVVHVKRGVRLPPVLRIYRAAEQAYGELGQACTITSALEGRHQPGSRHYTAEALDFRTRHMPTLLRQRVADRIRVLLGKDYDVVLEATHLHVEYDPKPPATEASAAAG